jgi:hypothetical protein
LSPDGIFMSRTAPNHGKATKMLAQTLLKSKTFFGLHAGVDRVIRRRAFADSAVLR